MGDGLDDREYRAKRLALLRRTRRLGLPCWICHADDWDFTNPKSKRYFTADHVEFRSHGGALLGELRPAHLECNSRRGARGTVVKAEPTTALKW